MKKIQCPVCNGCGEIDAPLKGHPSSKEKIKQIKNLRSKGFSLRAIAKIMGYSSPSTIQHFLNQNKQS